MAIASVASDLNRFAICHLFTSLEKAGAHPAEGRVVVTE
jgi:hypothetical protein